MTHLKTEKPGKKSQNRLLGIASMFCMVQQLHYQEDVTCTSGSVRHNVLWPIRMAGQKYGLLKFNFLIQYQSFHERLNDL